MNKEKTFIKKCKDNISGLCSGYSKDILKNYQKNTDNKYKKLDYVKSKIDVTKNKNFEHLWIFVSEVDEEKRTVTGSLSSDPLHLNSKIKYGEKLTISFDKIEEIIPHTHVKNK